MEEVDSIILHFLRQLNINIDQETKNICELSVEVIVEAVSKCLLTINPLLKIPTRLPAGISQRIEVAAQIASACKDLGYKNDVGYQTLLYFNEAELRHVFMFLIERLPNEGKQSVASTLPGNTKSLLMCSIKNKISEELNTIWIPPCCNSQIQNSVGDFLQKPVTLLPRKNEHISVEEIIDELKEIGKDKYLKATDCAQTDNIIKSFDKHTDELENNEIEQENRSIRELKELSIVLRHKLDTLEAERNKINFEYSQAQKSCGRAEAELRNVQNILNNIGIADLNPEDLTDDLFEKVQTSINMLHTKSEELTSQNLSLKVEMEKIKNDLELESQRTICKKVLVNLKETAKSMKEELERKEAYRNQVIKNYEKVKGGNKRSIYTKRILEIINNVDKQNVEIQKILEDTRQLQKEINTLEGQLDRCFSIADETLFRDAKKDDQAKKAYKLLALLHSECNTIVSLVNETGALARDIVDLEDNIKTERAKRVEDTLKKIQLDIIRIKEESNDF